MAACGICKGESPAEKTADPALQELQAAQMMEATVLARGPNKEDFEKLERLFDDLAARHPKSAAIRNGHAELLWMEGERASAIQGWQEAEHLDPKNPVILNHLGGCALDSGEVQRAAGYFQRAVEAAPSNAEYHFDLANVLFMFRKELPTADKPEPDEMIAEAMRHYAEAVRLNPLSEELAKGQAETFLTLPAPDWRGAVAPWEHLLQITEQKEFALINLARIHLKLGEKEKARECLSRVKSPDFGRLKAKLSAEAEQD